MPAEFINELVIKTEAMDGSVLFLKQSLSQAGLELTAQRLGPYWPACLSFLSTGSQPPASSFGNCVNGRSVYKNEERNKTNVAVSKSED